MSDANPAARHIVFTVADADRSPDEKFGFVANVQAKLLLLFDGTINKLVDEVAVDCAGGLDAQSALEGHHGTFGIFGGIAVDLGQPQTIVAQQALGTGDARALKRIVARLAEGRGPVCACFHGDADEIMRVIAAHCTVLAAFEREIIGQGAKARAA